MPARCRGTPRIANRLLRRVRDYAEVKADGRITRAVAMAALTMMDVDIYGFDEIDRKLMLTILEKYNGGPVGVGALSAAISEDEDSIEDIYEPYLIQIGFLDRTPRGRVATRKAFEHFRIHAADQPEKPVLTGECHAGMPSNLRTEARASCSRRSKPSCGANREAVKLALVCLLAEGHLLIEDVPGVGKTTLARIAGPGIRLHVSPDPVHQRSAPFRHSGHFRVQPGRTGVRIPPRADLRQRGSRRRDQSHDAQDPERPARSDERGENQRRQPDLYRCRALSWWSPPRIRSSITAPIRCPNPSWTASCCASGWGIRKAMPKRRFCGGRTTVRAPNRSRRCCRPEDILEAQQAVAAVRMDESLLDYILAIVEATRQSEFLVTGASPRGSLALHRAAQALACYEGRDYCIPDDIKRLALPVLAHRVIVSAKYSSPHTRSGGGRGDPGGNSPGHRDSALRHGGVDVSRWRSPFSFSFTAAGAAFILVVFLIALGAVRTGNNLLYLVLAVLLSAIPASGIFARLTLRAIFVSLQVPQNVFEGEQVSIKISLSNQKRWVSSFSIQVEDLSLIRGRRRAWGGRSSVPDRTPPPSPDSPRCCIMPLTSRPSLPASRAPS